MNLTIEVPINGLSFGQTAINILKQLHKRGLTPNIMPIGESGDISAFDLTDDFKRWLQECIGKAPESLSPEDPSLKLWHLRGSMTNYGRDRSLLTFHETDQLTAPELNALKVQDNVFVTSKFTQGIFEAFGATNVTYVPLGFDSDSFYPTYRQYFPSDLIVFGLGGKLEKRKGHFKVLRAWAKKYGNDRRYRLNCAVHNSFLDQNAMMHQIGQALEGKEVRNINFVPHMKLNRDYNDYLNANHIYIAMSGGEGFDLPAFQSLALGTHVVGLRAHVYEDYMTDENAVLVDPSNKEGCYDGIFFKPNQPFNQGSLFTFDEDEFIAGCEAAEARYRANPINIPGKKLADQSYAQTVDTILSKL